MMSNKLEHNGPKEDKAQVIINKLKRQLARLDETDNDEPDFERMRRDAMKSLHLFSDVERTDEGYQIT